MSDLLAWGTVPGMGAEYAISALEAPDCDSSTIDPPASMVIWLAAAGVNVQLSTTARSLIAGSNGARARAHRPSTLAQRAQTDGAALEKNPPRGAKDE